MGVPPRAALPCPPLGPPPCSTGARRDVPLPREIALDPEHELVPVAKGKDGFPILRLRAMQVSWMGLASQASPADGRSAGQVQGNGVHRPRTLPEREETLRKRRLVRALEVFRGSLLDRKVRVGTEKHPEEVTPPEPDTPGLDELLAFVVVFGTGRPIGPDGEEDPAGIGSAGAEGGDPRRGPEGAGDVYSARPRAPRDAHPGSSRPVYRPPGHPTRTPRRNIESAVKRRTSGYRSLSAGDFGGARRLRVAHGTFPWIASITARLSSG